MNLYMSNIFSVLFFVLLVSSCAPETETSEITSDCATVKKLSGERKNLNVSIFLDLSDRISPSFNSNPSMEHWERDLGYIKSIAEAFEVHLRNKRTVLINDNIKLFFEPNPENIDDIDNIVKTLDKSFTRDNATLENICAITSDYSSLTKKIYSSTLEQKEPAAIQGKDDYPGSDIFDFFKSKVKDYCIKDNHRNVLFILTDGYMYMKNTNNKNNENKSNYVLSSHLSKWGFNSKNYQSKLSNEGYGFQVPVTGLENLEVVVIGLVPNHSWELDVLNSYWSEWFKAMGVSNFQDDNWNSYLKQPDLPSVIDNLIQDFMYK